jgi:hypothetical protein
MGGGRGQYLNPSPCPNGKSNLEILSVQTWYPYCITTAVGVTIPEREVVDLAVEEREGDEGGRGGTKDVGRRV